MRNAELASVPALHLCRYSQTILHIIESPIGWNVTRQRITIERHFSIR